MRNIILSLMVVFVALSAAGCATTCQSVTIPDQSKKIDNPQMARIYVVRPTAFGGAISIRITDNDKYIGNTGPNGYLCWERQTGKAEIAGKAENISTVTLDVKADEVYYICQHIKMGWWYARNELEVINADKGKEFLNKCKPPVLRK